MFVSAIVGRMGSNATRFCRWGMGMKLLGNLNIVANTDETTHKCVDAMASHGQYIVTTVTSTITRNDGEIGALSVDDSILK